MADQISKEQSAHPCAELLLRAFDRELVATELSAVSAHVRDCPECASRWRRLEHLSAEVSALQSTTDLPRFSLRLPDPAGVVDSATPGFRRSSSVRLAAALAATLAIALGLWLMNRSSRAIESNRVPQVADAKPVQALSHYIGGGGAPAHADHAVALLQHQLRQVSSVLASDTGDQAGRHKCSFGEAFARPAAQRWREPPQCRPSPPTRILNASFPLVPRSTAPSVILRRVHVAT